MIRAVSTVILVRDASGQHLTHHGDQSQSARWQAGATAARLRMHRILSTTSNYMNGENVDDHPAHTTTELTHECKRKTQ